MKDKLLYICHPYTGDIEVNILKVNTICNQLLNQGYWIYSPLTMSHPLEQLRHRDHSFWIKQDLKMLEKCDVLVLCEGWQDSKGCCMEYERALRLPMEIVNVRDLLHD